MTARRSSFDGRNYYHRLDLPGCAQALADAARALHPGLGSPPAANPEGGALPRRTWPKVLFV